MKNLENVQAELDEARKQIAQLQMQLTNARYAAKYRQFLITQHVQPTSAASYLKFMVEAMDETKAQAAVKEWFARLPGYDCRIALIKELSPERIEDQKATLLIFD